jgi:hypothetical protein
MIVPIKRISTNSIQCELLIDFNLIKHKNVCMLNHHCKVSIDLN